MNELLIADIGGTTTRIALAAPGGRPTRIVRFENDDIEGIDVAIQHYLDGLELDGEHARPRRAVLAVAGPINTEEIRLTNRPWHFRIGELEAQFDFARVQVINDFQAVAWSLPALSADELLSLGGGAVPAPGPKVALGPGTGLGVAALVPVGEDWLAIATEAGHMSFGPAHDDEVDVFKAVGDGTLATSAEMAVSGRGLERLYHAMNPHLPPQAARAVVSAAQAGDVDAVAVLDMFVRLFGRFAGDLALTFKATGGVYIAGGVARRFGALFNSGIFRAAFEAHPPYQDMLAKIPTFLVTYTEPGLVGCAAYAARRVG